jgi:UDP-N-acetylmuramate dehydrogenase
MMAAERTAPMALIERLPPVRGRYTECALLSRYTWFRVGGPAEIFFRPADPDDLAGFLANKPIEVPETVIGVGSNILVRDGGMAGVVIRLGRGFADIEIDGDVVRVGAGAHDVSVAAACRDAGLAGLEFLSGIPGTIGGALRMNAGAFGTEIADVLVEAVALDARGRRHKLSRDDLGLTYRHCALPRDLIFISATLRGGAGDRSAIARLIEEIQGSREESQPTRGLTGGSTFLNPGGPDPDGVKAWELIDRAGCRRLRHCDAMVSEKHCNFLVNRGSATAEDLEQLGEEVRRRVRESSGVNLEWEIERIGALAPRSVM